LYQKKIMFVIDLMTEATKVQYTVINTFESVF